MLNRIITPDHPELNSPESENGLMVGFIPARLVKIESGEDPEQLGRVKVQCDLFSKSEYMPNSYDGWVFVLTRFCNTGSAGGDHPMLEEGNQVALLPMLGDPTQLLMIGAIHNRTDKPNPLFDRSKGQYGKQTVGGVFEINNDRDLSQHTIFPHGVSEVITKEGSYTVQTAAEGRLHITADGTTTVANKHGSTKIGKDGTLEHRSEAGDVSLTLNKDGTGKIKTGFDSVLELGVGNSIMTGPALPIFTLIKRLKSEVLSRFGTIKNSISKLGALISKLEDGISGDELFGLMAQSVSLIDTVTGGVTGAIETGKSILSQIQSTDLSKFGEYLMPQVEAVLSPTLKSLLPGLKTAIQGGGVNTLLQSLKLPELGQPDLQILDSLKLQPEQAFQFVLSKVAPGGYESFSNLANLGLLETTGTIEESITVGNTIARDLFATRSEQSSALGETLSEATASAPNTSTDLIQKQIDKITSAFPKEIQGFVRQSGLFDKILGGWMKGEKVDFGGFMESALGSVAKGFINNALSGLVGGTPYVAALPIAQKIIGGLFAGKSLDLKSIAGDLLKAVPGIGDFAGLGDLANKPLDFLKGAINPIVSGLGGFFKKGIKSLNGVLNAVPKLTRRSRVEANPESAGLIGSSGRSRVWADEFGAGIASRWGGFNFSKDGGELIGKMLMKVAQGTIGSALSIDPDSGVLSILGTDDTGTIVKSKVEAKGDTVAIEAGRHQLVVNPEGVFIDGYNLSEISRWADALGRLELIEQRLLTLGV
jgi:hypothetical protein